MNVLAKQSVDYESSLPSVSIQHLPGGTKQQPCGEDREQTSAAATFRAIDAATNGTRKSEILQRLAEIIDSANDKISQQDQRQHASDQQNKIASRG